jgi:hypothetical protein
MYYSREVKDEKELFKNMIDVAIKLCGLLTIWNTIMRKCK